MRLRTTQIGDRAYVVRTDKNGWLLGNHLIGETRQMERMNLVRYCLFRPEEADDVCELDWQDFMHADSPYDDGQVGVEYPTLHEYILTSAKMREYDSQYNKKNDTFRRTKDGI